MAVACWGESHFGWFLGENVEKSKRRNSEDLRPAAMSSGDCGEPVSEPIAQAVAEELLVHGLCCDPERFLASRVALATPCGVGSDRARRRVFEGDNRRKKFWRTLASLVAGVCWGESSFGWFLGDYVEKSKRRNSAEPERGA